MTNVRMDLPFGSFISGEEIGEWFGARNYKKTDNINMSGVLQTFRDKQLGVTFTLPEARMADKNARTMGDIIIETLKINRKEEFVECKIFYVETNARTSEKYEKFPVMRDEEGNKKTITRLRIYKPPEAFIPLYKEKKGAFNDQVNAKAHDAIRKVEQTEEEEDIRQKYKCIGKCKGHVFRSNSMRPRCNVCQSSRVVVDES